MKILHTSDWHLGHSLYNYDRTEEQLEMINQMVNIVSNEKPDIFLLSGDVYHTAQPSNAVQTLFADAITRIHNANPAMTIITTAGNHDSGSKHEIFKSPWRAMNVHMVGNLEKDIKDYDNHIIDCACIVIAVPYCYERNMPEDIWQQLINRAQTLNTENKPIIMMAHTTVKGCDTKGHEDVNDYMVGGIEGVDLSLMGEGYDYLALGHIHHAQWVNGSQNRVRYSGSPIAVSFDEQYIHTVTIIELNKHGDIPHTRTIEIHNPHPLVTLPTEGFATWEEAKKLLQDYPNDISSYIRLNVEIEQYLPADANHEAQALTKDKSCRFCYINVHRAEKKNANGQRTMTLSEFKHESPKNMLIKYLNDLEISDTDELLSLFDEAESRAIDDIRQSNE